MKRVKSLELVNKAMNMEQLDQKLSDFITLLNERDENTQSCLVEIKNFSKNHDIKIDSLI